MTLAFVRIAGGGGLKGKANSVATPLRDYYLSDNIFGEGHPYGGFRIPYLEIVFLGGHTLGLY